MPHTLGTPNSSVLYTLARSIGEVPRVELPLTGAQPGGRDGADPAFVPARDGRSERIRFSGLLGRGGMGDALKGHDTDLGRDLAIEVLKEPFRDQPEMIRRFVEEARIGGQLQHPGVVPVYELGSLADRRPDIAMRLVDGRTLAGLLAEREGPRDDLPRLLGIFESVCQTMAYAHARGVIHRDLKPSNIMVGSFGEVQVMDWGLAKVLAKAEPGRGEVGDRTERVKTVGATRPGEIGGVERGTMLSTGPIPGPRGPGRASQRLPAVEGSCHPWSVRGPGGWPCSWDPPAATSLPCAGPRRRWDSKVWLLSAGCRISSARKAIPWRLTTGLRTAVGPAMRSYEHEASASACLSATSTRRRRVHVSRSNLRKNALPGASWS